MIMTKMIMTIMIMVSMTSLTDGNNQNQGTGVLAAVWSLHHDPAFWNDPWRSVFFSFIFPPIFFILGSGNIGDDNHDNDNLRQ